MKEVEQRIKEEPREFSELLGFPSLDMSSGSEEVAGNEQSSSDQNLLDLSEEVEKRKADSRDSLTEDLLRNVAAIHFQTAELDESRSCFSSPGKMNFTLREKLSRLSRSERRELLMKTSPIPDNSLLEEANESFDETRDAANSYQKQEVSVEPEKTENNGEDSLFRLKRQAQYGHHTELRQPVIAENHRIVKPPRTTNRICLNIYDLIAHDTLMQLPWGCVFEIGKCFNEVNSALHELGTGAYHVGVEINGIEYAYGATSLPDKPGIFSCIPKLSPGYQYRTSIDFGEVPLIRKTWVQVPGKDPKRTEFQQIEEFVDGRTIVKEMAPEYLGIDYDILRKNCCTFAHDACLRLGVQENKIPSWFRNLAETGAMTQDVANATLEPLQKVLSGCENNDDSSTCSTEDHHQSGFEVIARRNAANTKDVLVVVDTQPKYSSESSQIGFKRTATWAY